MEKRRLMVDTNLCTGCGSCALVCAACHSRQWDPALGRIKPRSDRERKLELAITCAHCQEAPCASACLMNVIYLNPDTRLVQRNLESCIGCRACEISCPFAAAIFDYIHEKVVNCDLCDGRPVCVDYCPTGALCFVDIDRELDRYRQEQLQHNMEICLQLKSCLREEGR